MDEPLNPYSHWLGLADVRQRPDHYALLGLDRFESDPRLIKTAADRATTRVRGFRPGDKARQWAALLDELDAARTCLSDPAAKAHYDEQLRGGNAATGGDPDVASAADSATTVSAPVNAAMYPPGLGPAPLPEQPRYGPAGPPPDDVQGQSPAVQAPVGDPSMFAPGFAPPSASPAATAHHDNGLPQDPSATTSSAGYNPAQTPGRLPMGREDVATAALDPMAPLATMTAAPLAEGDPMAPLAMPVETAEVAQPIDMASTPLPVPVADSPSANAAVEKVSPQEKPRAQRSASGLKLLIAGLGAVAAIAIGVSGLLMFLPETQEPGVDATIARIGDVDGPNGDDPEAEPPPEVQPGPPTVDADPITPAPEAEPEPAPELEPPTPDPDPLPPITNPEPLPPITDPDPTPAPEPPTPEPEPPPQPLTPAEKGELRKALVGARTAMGDRDQAAVAKHLATATVLARSDEHKALVKRLGELNHYVKEFWRSVDEAYNNLQPETTIKVGNSEAAIVEVDARKLILRYFGSNRTILRNEIPSGLAMAIANNWFTDDPVNKVVKGALLLVDPNGRPEETRQLWQEAQAAGVDVGALMPVLDDTYDF